MKTFYTSSGPRVFIMLFIAYLIIFAPVVAILIDPSGANLDLGDRWYFALIPLTIFLFFLYVITASVLKMFIKFTITKKGILIYKPLFHRKYIRMDEIEKLSFYSEEETNKLIRDSLIEQESYKDSMDIVAYFKMIKKKSPAYRYYTNAATTKLTGVGPKDRMTSLKVNASGEIVFLQLKNGDYYYLTPAQPTEFIKFVESVNESL